MCRARSSPSFRSSLFGFHCVSVNPSRRIRPDLFTSSRWLVRPVATRPRLLCASHRVPDPSSRPVQTRIHESIQEYSALTPPGGSSRITGEHGVPALIRFLTNCRAGRDADIDISPTDRLHDLRHRSPTRDGDHRRGTQNDHQHGRNRGPRHTHPRSTRHSDPEASHPHGQGDETEQPRNLSRRRRPPTRTRHSHHSGLSGRKLRRPRYRSDKNPFRQHRVRPVGCICRLRNPELQERPALRI